MTVMNGLSDETHREVELAGAHRRVHEYLTAEHTLAKFNGLSERSMNLGLLLADLGQLDPLNLKREFECAPSSDSEALR